MKFRLAFENIYFRNLLVAAFFWGLISLRMQYADMPDNFPDIPQGVILAFFLVTYALVFLHNHFAVRKLLMEKRVVPFVLFSCAFLLFRTLLAYGILTRLEFPTSFVNELFASLMVLIMGTAVYITYRWMLNNIIDTQKKLLQQQTELNFLKQQLSPHFLFNAINNLYGTSLAAPEVISEKILELSELLRYQIEATTKDEARLNEEMQFMEHYLSYTLYKTNNLEVRNQWSGTYEGLMIPPLLFLPLLENAVKYAAEAESRYIHIHANVERNDLEFEIVNSCIPEKVRTAGTGIGLANLKRRLEILDIRYALEVDSSVNDTYTARLKLWNLRSDA